jgi:hypothetical protein
LNAIQIAELLPQRAMARAAALFRCVNSFIHSVDGRPLCYALRTLVGIAGGPKGAITEVASLTACRRHARATFADFTQKRQRSSQSAKRPPPCRSRTPRSRRAD